MTVAHWLYLLGVVVILLTMIWRKNIVIPCILFTLAVGFAYKGNFIQGITSTFSASLVAAKELFSIFLIIAIMIGMLKSISITGADRLMVTPLRKLMVNPLVSYIIIAVTTFLISLFFWPTPATPLVGALLLPVAIESGLPPMMGAVAIAIAGQGMALGGDIVIQGAPGFLFDIGKMVGQAIPPTGFVAGFGMMLLGVITGVDGSGFAGLPLVGTMAAALAKGSATVAATLGALGQIGAVYTGGGTLIAWSSLVAVAGIVGVPVLDLARKNFIPVVTGMIVAGIVGVLFLM